jgi:hypothetical protein
VKNHFIGACSAVLVALAIAATLGPTPVEGQGRGGRGQAAAPAQPAQPAPRMPDGKPDFNGFFTQPVGAEGGPRFSPSKMSPFKPGGEALFFELHNGDPLHDEPRDFCWPSGFPWGFLAPYPIQIVQTPKYMVMVHEFQTLTRIIPLDGRPHSANKEPSLVGDSVGHWEGDTLVIDSRNFKRWILDDYHYVSGDRGDNPRRNRMKSDAFHTIERMRRVDMDRISWEITIDDPKIFTTPWTEEFTMRHRPEWEKDGIFEFVCQENNRCPGGTCAEVETKN